MEEKDKRLNILRERVIQRIDVTKDILDTDIWEIIDDEILRFNRQGYSVKILGIQEKLIYRKTS